MIRMISNIVFLLMILTVSLNAQKQNFTRQDTLRGSITPERAWWDLTYYHLSVKVNPDDSSFAGTNLVQYKVLDSKQVMQIDLQPPMEIINTLDSQVSIARGFKPGYTENA